MKSNVESRVKNFQQELDKFSARWHQLKPGDDALEGNKGYITYIYVSVYRLT